MEDTKYIIEIASSDFATTKSAVEGGADRIELCANLMEGGVTPGYGTIRACREAFSVALYPIIRPRGGDFLFSKEEFEIMQQDLRLCKELGCDGIVIGLLLSDGTIDIKRTSKLVDLAYPLGVTFHRAFDRCREPLQALETIIETGCERILTSGQKPDATDAIDLIRQLHQAADGRIIIMPGSGLRPDNIKMMAEQTGCTEFHSSLRKKIKTGMQFIHPEFADEQDTLMNNFIDSLDVAQLRKELENLD